MFSPPLGGAAIRVDSQVDKCCGLGGGGNFKFYVRWNLSIDNGVRTFTGQNQVLPAGATIPVVVQIPCDGKDSSNNYLSDGQHAFNFTAQYVRLQFDSKGVFKQEHIINTQSSTANFEIDSTNPVINVTGVEDGRTYSGAVTISYTAEDLHLNTLMATLNGQPFSSGSTVTVDGNYVLTIIASDTAGNNSIRQVNFRISRIVTVPPDPAAVAPPVDNTVATTISHATEFLYIGSNPIQTGVAPGTIEAKRAAVLRGKVTGPDGAALSGVKITILKHLEYGYTATRTDGMFDMAVNGGSWLTVQYEKDGYISVQRQVDVPWQDYAWLPDVVMIRYDSKVTTIDLTAGHPMQAARGNPVTDGDGTRQATLIFPEALTALMDLPGGKMQSLTSLSVRATEYTVGPNGPKAMPALLPPTSGYTYAVEYSIDEAVAAGAEDVRFNKPVISYIENFLNFPVGGIVPVGYYYPKEGTWIASKNGRIVMILGINNGLTDLDIDGSGVAASATALASLGITDAERQQLAILYQPGQSLWRVTIPHFSPWDYNWPFGPPANAEAPKMPEPKTGDLLDDPSCSSGSIVECQNQILGESINITGTPFSLHYGSDRAPGRLAARALEIPISGATVPASLKRIELEISVAGRLFTQSFSAAPNQRYTFVWDGQDAYVRTLQGAQPANIRIGYVYDAVYYQPAQLSASFGSFSGIPITGSRARQEITLWQEQKTNIGTQLDSRTQGLGAWTLSAQHAYDVQGQVLYLGSGGRKSAKDMNNVITTVAGNGIGGYSGDGGPATSAQLNWPYGLAVDGQGSLFIADTFNYRIRKVSSDGVITTVAGNGVRGYSGDGGPATSTSLHYPHGVAVDGQGNLFIADHGNYRIRKVSPDGIITTVAGNGVYGYSGDGGPATSAQLSNTYGLAVDGQGNLFIAEYCRIRKVGPDGIITTVAGNGTPGYSGDGGPATSAQLNRSIIGVAVDGAGNLFIADHGNYRIRKVSPDGIITTVAGNGVWGYSGDGGPATSTSLHYPHGVAVDGQGNLFIADYGNYRIRKVSSDGIITTVAGNGNGGYSGDEGPATSAQLNMPTAVAVDGQGNLFISDSYTNRVRKVSVPLPGFSGQDIAIPSEDGIELYHFNAVGKHLRTLDALTGVAKYTFTCDAAGLLISIADKDGNITTIERDGSGDAMAIIAPGGQRTSLDVDANGYLSSIANPASEATQLVYTTDGLLTTLTDPKGNVHRFTYDDLGRLIKDENPAGGYSSLSRTDSDNSYTVTLSSALGRTNTYLVENLSTGDTRRVDTNPDGTKTTTVIATNGTRTITSSDSMVTTITEGPDPRFGMQSPLISNMKITTPGGKVYSLSEGRAATLADTTNPLTLTTLTDTVSVNGRTYTSAYDAATKTITATTPAGRQAITTLDNQGRVAQTKLSGLDPVSYTYDTQGRLTAVTQGVRQYSFNYDALNQLNSITDPLSRSVGFTYDLAGRVTQQTLPDSNAIAYAFDANSNVTSLTSPGKPAHGFTYTPTDLLQNYLPPSIGAGSTSTTYGYNLDKQIDQTTRPDGQNVAFSYDNGGRLSAVTIPQGSISYSYAATGKISSINAPNGEQISYAYDGSLVTGKTWSGIVSGSVSLGYSNDFLVSSESVNNANTVNFTYDSDNLLIGAGNLTLTRSSQNGLLTGTTLGSVATGYNYNTLGEANQISANAGGSTIFNAQYTRDNLGRIIQKTETVGGVTDTYVYGYNTAGRLATVTKNGIAAGSYAYDANGNRIFYTGPNGALTGSYDNQDRLITYGANTYTYTANGDLLSKTANGQTTSYSYDALGNLLSVTLPDATSAEYVIDGQNRRIGKKINGVLQQGFLYQDQLRPVAELSGAGTVVSRFVYATKANVPDYMMKGGNTYRIITDHLGSPRMVIDTASGTIVQRMDYDEFGNVIVDTNPGFQPFGFAGGLYDQHTKLTRFGARDYDAETGRWTAKDPIRFVGGDTNLYGYVGNNPVNWTDPFGLRQQMYTGAGGSIVVNSETGAASRGFTQDGDISPRVPVDASRWEVFENIVHGILAIVEFYIDKTLILVPPQPPPPNQTACKK